MYLPENGHLPGLGQESIPHSNRFPTSCQDSSLTFQSGPGSDGLSGQETYCGLRNTIDSEFKMRGGSITGSVSGDDGISMLSTPEHFDTGIRKVNLGRVRKAREVQSRRRRSVVNSTLYGKGHSVNLVKSGTAINESGPLQQLENRAKQALREKTPDQESINRVTRAGQYRCQYSICPRPVSTSLDLFVHDKV